MPKKPKADVTTSNHGASIILVTPVTKAARDWISENVEGGQWFGNSLAVEPRFFDTLVDGMMGDGLVVA